MITKRDGRGISSDVQGSIGMWVEGIAGENIIMGYPTVQEVTMKSGEECEECYRLIVGLAWPDLSSFQLFLSSLKDKGN